MQSEKYTAICLNAIDYRESDKLLTLYAKGKGKIVATLRGCKSPKSKLKAAGSPLCFGEYEFSITHDRYIVTGISDAELFYNLWSDLDKFYIALSMLEVFNKFTYDNEVYDDLFLELLKGLNALNDGLGEPYQIFVHYLYQITSILGYAPCIEGCVKCGDTVLQGKKFSIVDGGIVCSDCGNGIALNDEVMSILHDAESTEFDDFIREKYNKVSLLNVIYIFSRYIEHILGEKVKSLCQFLDNLM